LGRDFKLQEIATAAGGAGGRFAGVGFIAIGCADAVCSSAALAAMPDGIDDRPDLADVSPDLS
jgi:hypothetical protein